jgi:hypothetical protein
MPVTGAVRIAGLTMLPKETIMGRSLPFAVVLAFTLAAAAPSFAQDALKSAAGVPTDVSEIVSGGNWSEGDNSGVFRAIVVTTTDSQSSQARVVVQMLAFEKAAASPKVAKTISIKEADEKKLPNAFLAMDVENDNEMTLIITSYDAEKDQDTSMMVKFDATGKYEVLPQPKDESTPDAGAEGKK